MPLGHWGLMILAVMVAAALTIAAIYALPGGYGALIAIPLLVLAAAVRLIGRGRQ